MACLMPTATKKKRLIQQRKRERKNCPRPLGPVTNHPALLTKTDGRHYTHQDIRQGTFESKPSSASEMSDKEKFFIVMNIFFMITISTMAWTAGHYVISEPQPEQDLLVVGEEEKKVEKKKPFMERLKERLASMVRVRKGLTIDSGAADHVMPAGWLWFLRVRPSPGSRSGLHYVAANNARLPNLGQSRLRFMSAEGTIASILFQIAAINKPLVSVSKLVDEGYEVIFTNAESYILHRETGKKILMKRERGVFIIEAFANPSDDFSRRG